MYSGMGQPSIGNLYRMTYDVLTQREGTGTSKTYQAESGQNSGTSNFGNVTL